MTVTTAAVRREVDPRAAGMDAGRLERITEFFEHQYLSTGKLVGCQIAVVRRGQLAYACSLGQRDRERDLPMADDTIFRIYSMTKPLASLALMQLYERGLFQLADPVHRYIPDWRTLQVGEVQPDGGVALVRPERPMNVRDVLTHMTGLPGALFPGNPIDAGFAEALSARKKGMTLEGVTALLAEHPLKFHPGTRWNYGLSTDIVGRLVEILSGQRLDDYLRTEIFEPLGMVDTGFMVPPESADRFAACYQYRPANSPKLWDEPTTSRYLRLRSYLSGAGGLVSTTADYVAFCRMLVGGGQLEGQRLIGRKTLELMTQNHLPGGATLADLAMGGFGEGGFEGVGFGLGFAVGLGPAATGMAGSAGDFYWGGAASTAFWIDPAEELFAVLMTQLFPSTAYPLRAQLRALVYQAIDD
jgi:CubicO group peptidase (beta-lactamase class C family)